MVTKEQETRGTHVKIQRGDYLLLCGLAGTVDEAQVLEIDNRAERLVEK